MKGVSVFPAGAFDGRKTRPCTTLLPTRRLVSAPSSLVCPCNFLPKRRFETDGTSRLRFSNALQTHRAKNFWPASRPACQTVAEFFSVCQTAQNCGQPLRPGTRGKNFSGRSGKKNPEPVWKPERITIKRICLRSTPGLAVIKTELLSEQVPGNPIWELGTPGSERTVIFRFPSPGVSQAQFRSPVFNPEV